MKTPDTSVRISQAAASTVAASATAVVSEPPLPSVVTSLDVGIDALESGDDHDLALLQGLEDTLAGDSGDPSASVRRIGEDPRLGPGETDRGDAPVVQGHRQERHRDALPCGQQHVHLPRVGCTAHLGSQIEE